MKTNRKPKPVLVGAIYSAAFLLTLGIAITASAVTNYYDAVIRDFMGVIGNSRSHGGDASLDKEYNKLRYDDVKDLDDYERQLVRDIGGEGYVLLQNKDNVLPLATSASNKTKVSLFSHSSVDLLAGGTGSGTGSLDTNLRDAFAAQGYEVNEKLWNFYSSGNGKGYVRATGSVNYGHGAETWAINECPLSKLEAEAGLLDSANGTTPIFVLSRTGGEGRDLARSMFRHTSIEEDKPKHYLEPDSVELGILGYLNDHFENVILVVNANNAMELGWVASYPHIKSVLWVPGGGGQTANSLVDVISGAKNPSGHLVDTFVYDNFSSPAMQNFGDVMYTVGGKPALSWGNELDDLDNTGAKHNVFYGVSYDEGIYVGYKYYETRYFDKMMGQGNTASYDYDTDVLYPFGYGLSYTSFAWSDFDVSSVDANGKITVTVKVKNTGEVAGKDVVGVYLNAPYTAYDQANHIEKSATSLVGYAKTKLLAKGESETLTITVDIADFKSYDDVGAKTYILENGDYHLTAAKDAHEATRNFLQEFGVDANGDASFVDHVSFAEAGADYKLLNKSASGAPITNHFDQANYIARDKYLTRADWEASFPITHGNQNAKFESHYSERNGYTFQEEISQELYAKLLMKGTAEAANNPNKDEDVISGVTGFGQKGELDLIDVRGKAFADVAWEELVKQMTTEEVGAILNLSGYTTGRSEAIVKPATSDLDGPMGLNLMATHEPFSIAYPAEVTIAATWNVELSKAHGDAIAQDGLRSNVLAAGWYGPGVNIHRTPFSGRNFEYYSEDSYMSGTMALGAIKVAAENGMYSFIKHFALNDQEDHRDQNGVCSWSNEQAMREIYLKPFQMVFEGGTVETRYYEGKTLKTAQTPIALATMTSFNRIGSTWAGGDYRLLTEVLRNEWNFHGIALTDYTNGAESYMHTEQMLRAGGDAQLSQYGYAFKNFTAANTYYAKQAMSHVLFTVVNSNAMNGFVHGSTLGYDGFPVYYFIIIGLYTIAGAVLVTGTIFTIRSIRKKRALAR
ncbi:MAG: glycoside hydrolase family 3 C-terminal domain-containing protein [Bacilli bacterium]|nr:glycoside hydrolase family 3 C-terminal domain-containing protein [Bacilli bacterium]